MFDTTMKTAAEATLAQMKQAFQGFATAPVPFHVPPAVQEFAAQGAQTAKARLADAEAAARMVTAGAETLAASLAGTGTDPVRTAVAGAVANATMTIDAVQQVLAAPTLQEALQRQGDFLKTLGEANLARAQDGFARARDAATDGVKAMQAEAASFTAGFKAA